MRALLTVSCLAYVAMLTLLLLTPNPAGLFGLRRVSQPLWGDMGIHFTAFTALTVLVHAARWPEQIRGRTVLLLLGYGIAMESLQWFVPSRSVELKDYVENALGVLIGLGVYWAVLRAWPQRRERASVSLAAQLVRHAAVVHSLGD